MSSRRTIWNRPISLLVGITMVLSLTASASGETASLVSHMETTIRTIGPGQPSPRGVPVWAPTGRTSS